jgi:hypothetical protein
MDGGGCRAVTIILRHNENLELNLVEYTGAVSLAELKALAVFMARNPLHMQRDGLNLILPDADLSSIPLPELDRLFDYYATLFAPLKLQILRRSAWVCQSQFAQSHVRRWLSGDTRKAMSSNVRQFGTLAEAGEWLLLNEAEFSALQHDDGFTDVARFTAAARSR